MEQMDNRRRETSELLKTALRSLVELHAVSQAAATAACLEVFGRSGIDVLREMVNSRGWSRIQKESRDKALGEL
jgi:hypothetical protein